MIHCICRKSRIQWKGKPHIEFEKIKVSNWVSIKLIQSQYYLLYVAFVFLHKRCPIESRKPIFIGNRGTGVTKNDRKMAENIWAFPVLFCVCWAKPSIAFLYEFQNWRPKVVFWKAGNRLVSIWLDESFIESKFIWNPPECNSY